MINRRDNPRAPQQVNNYQYKQENMYRSERPRLHDMPYNTNQKDGKPVIDRPRNKETPDPLRKKGAYMVNNNLWCETCDKPHSSDCCVVAQEMQEEGMLVGDSGEDHIVYLTSITFHPDEDGYLSSKDEGCEYDVLNQRFNVHMAKHQVFFDSKDNYVEYHSTEVPAK